MVKFGTTNLQPEYIQLLENDICGEDECNGKDVELEQEDKITDLYQSGEVKNFEVVSISPAEHRLGLKLAGETKATKTKEEKAEKTSKTKKSEVKEEGEAAGEEVAEVEKKEKKAKITKKTK